MLYYFTIFVYITGTFRWSGMIKTKGKTCSSFANYWRLGKTRLFNLYRSRLYIPYFQTSFMPFRSWILFVFQPRTLFPFFTFHDEKLTRLNVRKNKGLKCEVKNCLTRNVARKSPFNGKHNKTFFTFNDRKNSLSKNKAIYLVQCCTQFLSPKYSSHPSKTLKIWTFRQDKK